MGLSRLSEKCRKCPFVDKCDKKRMEALLYLEPCTQPSAESLVQPIMRETMKTIIDGKVVTVYKDEVKKQLYKDLTDHLFEGIFTRTCD